MVLVEAFDTTEDTAASVVLGLYVGDTIISNDGFAFVELSPLQAAHVSSNLHSAATKVEDH